MYARNVGKVTGEMSRFLEQIALVGARYHWPAEPSSVETRICPNCEKLLNHAISCSCSRDALFGRLALASILRGPE